MVSKDFFDRAAGYAGKHRIGALIVREGNQPKPQRPASTSRPGRVIHLKCVAEDGSGFCREEQPRGHHIARRIADTQTPEIYDSAQPAIYGEQVPRL